jgi:hypothetical protein
VVIDSFEPSESFWAYASFHHQGTIVNNDSFLSSGTFRQGDSHANLLGFLAYGSLHSVEAFCLGGSLRCCETFHNFDSLSVSGALRSWDSFLYCGPFAVNDSFPFRCYVLGVRFASLAGHLSSAWLTQNLRCSCGERIHLEELGPSVGSGHSEGHGALVRVDSLSNFDSFWLFDSLSHVGNSLV